MKKYTPEERINVFWSRAEKSGGIDACWNWIAYRDVDGYGRMRWDNRCAKANRIAYQLTFGDFPNELKVLHSCDNPACINPKHLFLGTQVENIQDMVRKGRRASTAGENGTNNKLTWAQVQEIRSRYAAGGVLQRELGAEFGVTQVQISAIVRGKQWK